MVATTRRMGPIITLVADKSSSEEDEEETPIEVEREKFLDANLQLSATAGTHERSEYEARY